MTLIEEISRRQTDVNRPILISGKNSLTFAQIAQADGVDLSEIAAGDVVALVGDFNPQSIATLLNLIDKSVVLVPLTVETSPDHEYFKDTAFVNVVIKGGQVTRTSQRGSEHPMLQQLRASGNPGLVLFSSGTTGRPKAILHDFSQFLVRFRTPRPALVTMSFLLFDHIGGINTLFHTLFNNGQVVVPSKRSPAEVVNEIIANDVELLPTTPTFLRLLMLSGELGRLASSKLQVITYGTERMDEQTLARLAESLPNVDLRQTYGMSELGILRIKSRARDSLYMKVGGEGVTTRVNGESVLEIKSEARMIGYLNAPSPFDDEGWYDTKDIVAVDGEYLRITGRKGDLINIGGQKILPAEVERVALEMPGVAFAKAVGASNPITGQHIEVLVQPSEGVHLDKKQIAQHFRENLPAALQPHRIRIDNVKIGHRFKQL